MEALDGNAIAGALQMAFGREMTTALGTCTSCGNTNLLGTLRVYLRGPGSVARCPVCEHVQAVLIEARGVVCVDLGGLARLEPAATAES